MRMNGSPSATQAAANDAHERAIMDQVAVDVPPSVRGRRFIDNSDNSLSIPLRQAPKWKPVETPFGNKRFRATALATAPSTKSGRPARARLTGSQACRCPPLAFLNGRAGGADH